MVYRKIGIMMESVVLKDILKHTYGVMRQSINTVSNEHNTKLICSLERTGSKIWHDIHSIPLCHLETVVMLFVYALLGDIVVKQCRYDRYVKG